MDIQKVHIDNFGNFVVNDVMTIPDNLENRHYHMVQEWIDAGNTPTPYVEPEKSWVDKRTASMADGGYGTWSEQLEMIGEQGMDAYQAHIAKVKSDNPKP